MAHYLDDFIRVIPPDIVKSLKQINYEYQGLTNALGIPRNEEKDCHGITVEVLGIKLDTIKFEARLPTKKLNKTRIFSASALASSVLTLHEAETLAGFLSFYTQVVHLGRAFMSSLWEFIASFPAI